MGYKKNKVSDFWACHLCILHEREKAQWMQVSIIYR